MPMIHDRIPFARRSSGLEMGTGSFLIRSGWERLVFYRQGPGRGSSRESRVEHLSCCEKLKDMA